MEMETFKVPYKIQLFIMLHQNNGFTYLEWFSQRKLKNVMMHTNLIKEVVRFL